MTIVLLGTTVYISTLLSSKSSPTQIQKTKASAVTYSRTVDLPDFGSSTDQTTLTPTVGPSVFPTVPPTLIPTPPSQTTTPAPTLLAQAPSLTPSPIPTKLPTLIPTMTLAPTALPEPTDLPTPTLSPLLAYKSTGGVTPTLIPITNTGGMTDVVKAPSPTQKILPTGVQQLPDTGWIQTSSILFIVATSTILFSLLF